MDVVVGLVLMIVIMVLAVLFLRRAWRRGMSSPPPPTEWFSTGQRRNRAALDAYHAHHPRMGSLHARRYNRGDFDRQEIRSKDDDYR